MDVFFKELGQKVLSRWKQENFSLEKFPGIASAALDEQRPSDNVDLAALMREFLLNDDQPLQTQSGFGQPEIVAYEHPKFYIQLLFWLDGTTDIHQHEFSGAFHVLSGSSIHAHFVFENATSITPHFRVGDVRMKQIELLETGRTVPIISGSRCIHSLFHLDTPSVTVVVRTQNDPGTAPQFNYLPPHVALDPVYNDTLTMRRKQLLDVLEHMGDTEYPELARQMIAELDFERGFFILQHAMGHLRDLDTELSEWKATLDAFGAKHGSPADGIPVTLEECVRRDLIAGLRGRITAPEHRFFLALLLNVPTKTDLLALVAQRFPGEPPVETVLRWIEELVEQTDFGIAILDACFPEDLDVDLEDQPELFLAILRHSLTEVPPASGKGKKTANPLKGIPAPLVKRLQAVLADSSLRLLTQKS